MSAHTGASALLVLLRLPLGVQLDRREREGFPAGIPDPSWETELADSVRRIRVQIRNAIRRLLRAHRGRVQPAARAIGTSSGALTAAASAVGLEIRRARRGRPRGSATESRRARPCQPTR